MVDGSKEFMLSTADNPWNPWTNYDEWFTYDRIQGRDTTGFLARVANVSLDLSDNDMIEVIQDAIEEIVKQNINGNFIRVPKPVTI